MELNQARILLRKINQIFDAVSDSSSEPSRIEVDLLQDYTRQFYASLLPGDKIAAVDVKVNHQQKQSPVQTVAEVPAIQEKPTIKEPEPAPVAEAIPLVKESSILSDPEPVQEEQVAPIANPAPVTTPIPQQLPQEVTRSEKFNGASAESEVLFTMEEATDLSGKLRTSPIDDLSRAMGINERFLTINELFKGDHEAFDQVLRRLNDLPSFSAARTFLENEVISRYDWLDTKRLKKAGVFIQLVRRRYL